MVKKTSNIPLPGDRVMKRGLGFKGTVVDMNARGWTWIEWDEGRGTGRPLICDARELEIIGKDDGIKRVL